MQKNLTQDILEIIMKFASDASISPTNFPALASMINDLLDTGTIEDISWEELKAYKYNIYPHALIIITNASSAVLDGHLDDFQGKQENEEDIDGQNTTNMNFTDYLAIVGIPAISAENITETEIKGDDRQFLCIWGDGYSMEEGEEIRQDTRVFKDFTEAEGFDPDDIEKIDALEGGSRYCCDESGQLTIIRTK